MKLVSILLHICDILIRICILIASKGFAKVFGFKLFEFEPNSNPSSSTVSLMIHAKNIQEIVKLSGYIVREHVVTTRDGYLLVIHKLENPNIVSNGKIVYFHHGLLTNSELFVIGSQHKKNLPYLLSDLGYEVWLGNNRGNKYSRKHLTLLVKNPQFWNFSLDEFGYFDIPDTINYISQYYNHMEKINYIGFSQGCSQLFASLSLNPNLNSRLNLFIGLSPAIIPNNFHNSILKIVVSKSAKDTSFLYSLFGNRAILPSVTLWSCLSYGNIYGKIVDYSLKFLFGWSGANIDIQQKQYGYPHLFSNSSVKCLIHWFQIINSNRFQMFDETDNVGLSSLPSISSKLRHKSHTVAPFPIGHHLDVETLLFFGSNDSLVDINQTEKLILDQNEKMSGKLTSIICDSYEHMDTLWATDVYDQVFSKVIDYLQTR